MEVFSHKPRFIFKVPSEEQKKIICLFSPIWNQQKVVATDLFVYLLRENISINLVVTGLLETALKQRHRTLLAPTVPCFTWASLKTINPSIVYIEVANDFDQNRLKEKSFYQHNIFTIDHNASTIN